MSGKVEQANINPRQFFLKFDQKAYEGILPQVAVRKGSENAPMFPQEMVRTLIRAAEGVIPEMEGLDKTNRDLSERVKELTAQFAWCGEVLELIKTTKPEAIQALIADKNAEKDALIEQEVTVIEEVNKLDFIIKTLEKYQEMLAPIFEEKSQFDAQLEAAEEEKRKLQVEHQQTLQELQLLIDKLKAELDPNLKDQIEGLQLQIAQKDGQIVKLLEQVQLADERIAEATENANKFESGHLKMDKKEF